MLFTSFDYLLFLPVIFCLYWFVCNRSLTWQNILIIIASYIFYAWWDARILLLLIGSTGIDYITGTLIGGTTGKKKRNILYVGITLKLLVLGFFKYYNFFVLSFTAGFEKLGIHIEPGIIHVVLPLGISYYTFYGMSYIYDVYYGKCKPVRNVIDYAFSVSFFPLLISGPIERAPNLVPQIQNKRVFTYQQGISGCKLILWGFFKKIVISDFLASHGDHVFKNYTEFSAISLVWTCISYAFQLYADFSGYSDIAIGTAKLFGIEVMSNFKFPFLSTGVTEFWRRWHISLGRWFNDYVYGPLTIRWRDLGKSGIVLSLVVTFVLCGLWHGAGWSFIMYGFLHGAAMSYEFLTKKTRKKIAKNIAPSTVTGISVAVTFCFVSFAFIFFRSATLSGALHFIGYILSDIIKHPASIFTIPVGIKSIVVIAPFIFIDWRMNNNEREFNLHMPLVARYLVYLVLFVSTVVFFLNSVSISFIYAQF